MRKEKEQRFLPFVDKFYIGSYIVIGSVVMKQCKNKEERYGEAVDSREYI